MAARAASARPGQAGTGGPADDHCGGLGRVLSAAARDLRDGHLPRDHRRGRAGQFGAGDRGGDADDEEFLATDETRLEHRSRIRKAGRQEKNRTAVVFSSFPAFLIPILFPILPRKKSGTQESRNRKSFPPFLRS